MAIQVNDPNLSGLTAIAGHGPGNFSIAPTGALGLQALQQRNTQENALRQAQFERMQLQQQGGLQLGQQGILRDQMQQQGLLAQQQQGLDQQKMAQQDAQFGQSLGADKEKLYATLGQRDKEVDSEQYKTNVQAAMKTQEMQMKQLLEEKKETIKEKGAFASYGLLAMKGAKTPEEAQQIRNEIIKEAISKGHISKEEAQGSLKLPISEFQNGLMYKVMQYGAADEYKKMNDANKPTIDKSGMHMEFNPDGSLASYSQDPTLAAKTKAQETINDRSQALAKLGEMKSGFDPKLFTNLNQGKMWIAKKAERNKDIPIIGDVLESAAQYVTGKNPEERGEDIKKATAYMNAVEQFFNQSYKQPMTGAAVGKDELVGLRAGYLSGDMSASEYVGALEQLMKKYTGEKEFNQNFLRKGSDVSSGASMSGVRERMIQDGHSPEEVDAYLAKRKQ